MRLRFKVSSTTATGFVAPRVALDGLDKLGMIPHEIEGDRLQEERHVLATVNLNLMAEGFDARLDARLAFKATVHDRALVNPPPPVLPPQSDVHDQIERPERFPRLGRAPNHGQAGMGNEPFDEIAPLCPNCDLVERYKLDARGFAARPIYRRCIPDFAQALGAACSRNVICV